MYFSFCELCPRADGSVVMVEEISDGELMDLLAEVDETASTSSRLRPSTTNRPSSSTERRHSQRIQSRASGDPGPAPAPRPQTSWVSSALHTKSIICCSPTRQQVKLQCSLCYNLLLMCAFQVRRSFWLHKTLQCFNILGSMFLL